MNYRLLENILQLLEEFDEASQRSTTYSWDIGGFKHWIAQQVSGENAPEPDWENKAVGRSPESVISTLLVHLSRYAKMYSKAVIEDSEFSTQEDFIYLINLKAFGAMTKSELIRRNIQENPGGITIINRLIGHGWIDQRPSEEDKRSTIISISEKGKAALESQMDKIRKATSIVTGDLEPPEKMELIRLLQKLDDFHRPVYEKNLTSSELLTAADKKKQQ